MSLSFASRSEGQATPSGEANARQRLQAKLPADFPLPAESMDVDEAASRNNGGGTRVECKVPGYGAEKLLGFFRRELPKKGFTIVAQNPPRVTSFESPVLLVVKDATGSTRSVQVREDSDGNARFVVN